VAPTRPGGTSGAAGTIGLVGVLSALGDRVRSRVEGLLGRSCVNWAKAGRFSGPWLLGWIGLLRVEKNRKREEWASWAGSV
jgi:hypothetical protein